MANRGEKYLDKFENQMWVSYDIRDSWIPIVDEALDKIFEVAPDTLILQIKEKFGELRIYTTNAMLAEPFILEAEIKCAQTP